MLINLVLTIRSSFKWRFSLFVCFLFFIYIQNVHNWIMRNLYWIEFSVRPLSFVNVSFFSHLILYCFFCVRNGSTAISGPRYVIAIHLSNSMRSKVKIHVLAMRLLQMHTITGRTAFPAIVKRKSINRAHCRHFRRYSKIFVNDAVPAIWIFLSPRRLCRTRDACTPAHPRNSKSDNRAVAAARSQLNQLCISSCLWCDCLWPLTDQRTTAVSMNTRYIPTIMAVAPVALQFPV